MQNKRKNISITYHIHCKNLFKVFMSFAILNILDGQKWMENASGMSAPPNMPFSGERPSMFNGNQYPYGPYVRSIISIIVKITARNEVTLTCCSFLLNFSIHVNIAFYRKKVLCGSTFTLMKMV